MQNFALLRGFVEIKMNTSKIKYQRDHCQDSFSLDVKLLTKNVWIEIWPQWRTWNCWRRGLWARQVCKTSKGLYIHLFTNNFSSLSMFMSSFSNLQNIKRFVFSLVNTFSNLSMFMSTFSKQNIKRFAFLCSLTLSWVCQCSHLLSQNIKRFFTVHFHFLQFVNAHFYFLKLAKHQNI